MFVRFNLVQGTSSGSRLVQLYNGRAVISVRTNNGASVVSAKCENLSVVFLDVKKEKP
jgi:beta-galactosidase